MPPLSDALSWSAEFFAARFPIMPAHVLEEWTMASGFHADAIGGSDEVYDTAVRALARDLRRLADEPWFRDALDVASDQLSNAVSRTSQHADKREWRKANRSLCRYLSRATTRCTPFGLFAGAASGVFVDGETKLELADHGQWKIHTTLDSEVAVRLAERLARATPDGDWVVFRPNSSLELRGPWFYYIETQRAGANRKYELARCQADEALSVALECARPGASRRLLVETLVGMGFSESESATYISSLIDESILESECTPTLVSDEEPLDQLVRTLTDTPQTSLRDGLHAFAEHIAAGDRRGPIRGEDFFARTRTLAEAFEVETPINRLLQTDFEVVATRLEINRGIACDLMTAVSALERCQPDNSLDPLERMKRRFDDRYGRSEVALGEVLDPEFGIGFDEDGIHSISMSVGVEKTRSERIRLLGELVTEVAKDHGSEIVLSAGVLDRFGGSDGPTLPPSFCIAAVLGYAADGSPQSRFISALGPSGARTLGRFSRWDSQLRDRVQRFLDCDAAARPDAVFAEIVHWPQDRAGNVLRRPHFFDYEITYLGRSALPAERQIAVSDLFLSLEGNRFLMRSRRLNVEVVPRLTTAHHFADSKNLPVYRFLCALQSDGYRSTVRWDWDALRDNAWLPRVSVGRVVVSRERWRLSPDQIARLSRSTGRERYKAIQRMRESLGWPDEVVLLAGDSELLVHLDNPIAVDCLVDEMKSSMRAHIAEAFPRPQASIARSPRGVHVTELHIPVARAERRSEPAARRRPIEVTGRASRSFPPSSEWLYVKMYGGKVLTFEALREVVWPAVCKARTDGLAETFFWLRYSDPRAHIRFRLCGERQLWTEWYPELGENLRGMIEARRVSHIELDTYEREVERYGGVEGVVLAERHFDCSSEYVLQTVQTGSLSATSDAELFRAVLDAGQILAGFNLGTIASKLALTAVLGTPRVKKGLGERFFREHRGALERALGHLPPSLPVDLSIYPDRSPDFLRSVNAFAQESQRVAGSFVGVEGRGALACPRSTIAISLIHMHLNRLFANSTRENETLVYATLLRHFSSLRARSANQG